MNIGARSSNDHPLQKAKKARRNADYWVKLLERFLPYAPYLRFLHRQRQADGLALVPSIKNLNDSLTLPEKAIIEDILALRLDLREKKKNLAFGIAMHDLAGSLSLEEQMRLLSQFADMVAEAALRGACENLLESGTEGFAILGLGKLGGNELNYSSDIDIVCIYDDSRFAPSARDNDRRLDLAVRVTRLMIDLLDSKDHNGYVHRVDLRLRPDPYSMPVAIPYEAALDYYSSEALPWERAAFIKARPIAGDLKLGADFIEKISNFLWRRFLDYTITRDLEEMAQRIRDHNAQHDFDLFHYDLKRGRGGIREIEFYIQTHQLIHGGRITNIRKKGSMEALAALADEGLVPRTTAKRLYTSYRYLRALEHRLQMQDDAQTQFLPRNEEAMQDYSLFCGYRSTNALELELKKHTARVAAIFDDRMVEEQADRIPKQPQNLKKWVSVHCTKKAAHRDALIVAITTWRQGSYRAFKNPRSLELLETFLPHLLTELKNHSDIARATAIIDQFFKNLSSGVQLFSLFEANPAILERMVHVLTGSHELRTIVTRIPATIDLLLEPNLLEPIPDVDSLQHMLEGRLSFRPSIEEKLDDIMRWVFEFRVQIGMQFLENAASAEDCGQALSRVADCVINRMIPLLTDEFAKKHGRFSSKGKNPSSLAVLALGRYGGQALTPGSDLDLVFLFTGPHDRESKGGEAPLSATHYFNRLSQRLTTALEAPTSVGALFEIDTRLRPSGVQGLLAVTVDSFENYQRDDAWTWEHMALARARVVAGSDRAREELTAIIRRILLKKRNPDRLLEDILNMRTDISAHKPSEHDLDIKTMRGGLVDIEFILHFLQLRHNNDKILDPDLSLALKACITNGFLSKEEGERIQKAHALFNLIQFTQRLVGDEAPFDETTALITHRLKLKTAKALIKRRDRARSDIAAIWSRVFKQDIEL